MADRRLSLLLLCLVPLLVPAAATTTGSARSTSLPTSHRLGMAERRCHRLGRQRRLNSLVVINNSTARPLLPRRQPGLVVAPPFRHRRRALQQAATMPRISTIQLHCQLRLPNNNEFDHGRVRPVLHLSLAAAAAVVVATRPLTPVQQRRR